MRVAMILAAGRGERMRPLTDTLPKPLLQVRGKALIEHHLDKLHQAQYSDVVINHAWLGDKLVAYLGNGRRYGVNIHYSAEQHALETAGGIANAMPLLTACMQQQDCFTVINGDIFCNIDFAQLPQCLSPDTAMLVMVDNPAHNPAGDFYLKGGRLTHKQGKALTFSGVAVYHRAFFDLVRAQKQALAPLLREQIANDRIAGYHHQGYWFDIGTPTRLQEINQMEGF